MALPNIEKVYNEFQNRNLSKYNQDANTTLEDLILTKTNGPDGSFYYIRTMFYQNRSVTSNRSQVAIGYNNNVMYHRFYYGGTWSDWVQTSNAKIVTGIEFETGRIIDGKKEYGKRFEGVSLPSAAGNITISTGLTNINFIKMEGIVTNDANIISNIPFLYSGQPEVYHYFNRNVNTITIRVTDDMSSFKANETIYYTKN